MLRLTVLVLLFSATAFCAPQWSFTLNDDGSSTIVNTRRNGLVGTLQLKGVLLRGVPSDCAASSEGTLCKQWANFRAEITATPECVHNKWTSAGPVGPEAIVTRSWNVTGHLYGGPEQEHQYWPLDDAEWSDHPMVTMADENQGIAERYWLSSDGYFFYIHPETPLFTSHKKEGGTQWLGFTGRNIDPYPSLRKFNYSETICYHANAKEAHLYAIQEYLKKPENRPENRPDELMVIHPIWSTRYKSDINGAIIEEFASEIKKNGFEYSYLEIDDFWEKCYGSLEVNDKFSNMLELTEELHLKGFKVTLWIHPFINIDCVQTYDYAATHNYLVKNANGNTLTTWWNSEDNEAGYIDFTNPEAVEWWIDRLQTLKKDTGVDFFKFDAGETSWMPDNPAFKEDDNILLQPNIFTQKYVETVWEQFGQTIEFRVGHRTQELPIFVRMMDKESTWDTNGLLSLVTTLLDMNMAGYPFVLPGVVGGKGYDKNPDRELFIRWLQANVFMPSIQFSYVPWDFDPENIEIYQRFTEMHAYYFNNITDAIQKFLEDGTPVNPPIWWIAPEDSVAHIINDEFLLGEDILVAPVLVKGATSRDIYFPAGIWINPLRPEPIKGPTWKYDYPAALEDLPFFVLQ